MGIQVSRVQFDEDTPSLEMIMRSIFESAGIKVKCSIKTLLTPQQVEALAIEAGFKTEPTREILTYWLEHSHYQKIEFWSMRLNDKPCIEFQTGFGFRKTLMPILEEALIRLGGVKNTENE